MTTDERQEEQHEEAQEGRRSLTTAVRQVTRELHEFRNAALVLVMAAVFGAAALDLVREVKEGAETRAAIGQSIRAVDSTHTETMRIMDSVHSGRLDLQAKMILDNNKMVTYFACLRTGTESECAPILYPAPPGEP